MSGRWSAEEPVIDGKTRAWIEAYDELAPIERATLPPAQWYTSPEIATLERATVWRDQWVCAGPLAALSEPGRYLSGDIAGQPWAVIADIDGQPRGFWNICRHQGAILLDGDGALPRGSGDEPLIRCPYHGWTWRCDGQFRHAPKLAGVEDFDRRATALWPLHVLAWGPLVLIAFGPTPPPPPSSALLEIMDATGWRDLSLIASEEFVVQANWKVFIDNYLDGGYHVPVAHPGLNAGLDGKSYTLERGDGWSIQRCDASGDDPRVAGQATYAWLYPGLCLNRYGDWLDLNIVEPISADRCRVRFYWLNRSASLPQSELESALEDSRQVQHEDDWLCERVQRGKASTRYEPGRYVPKMEPLERDFHRWLKRDYLRPA